MQMPSSMWVGLIQAIKGLKGTRGSSRRVCLLLTAGLGPGSYPVFGLRLLTMPLASLDLQLASCGSWDFLASITA